MGPPGAGSPAGLTTPVAVARGRGGPGGLGGFTSAAAGQGTTGGPWPGTAR